ncbi:MAG: glycoside hydrolase family 78 protein [Bacteroidaceae bacterium]|nr:glycoside hydrolase family 78 protein [Bacteroidaceae bacterium]
MKRILCLLSFTFYFSLFTLLHAIGLYDLRCEMLHQPWGIDNTKPALSWKITPGRNGLRQTAYQILAATSPELLSEEKADLWNTGKVKSSESLWVTYDGKPLTSRSVVYWQVRAWDEEDKAGDWARGAHFSVGILDRSLWNGQYIGMKRENPKVQPMLRKVFNCSSTGKPAFLHINTLGYHEVYLNGQKVSDDVLVPAMVEFPKRSLAMTYNVTDLLVGGENDLVIWLGTGWYEAGKPGVEAGGPYVMAQIDQMADGQWETLVKTDETWQARTSGYYFDGSVNPYAFGGDKVVAEELLPDLTHATLEKAEWQQAVVNSQFSVEPSPKGGAGRGPSPMMCEPNKVQQAIQAQKITRFGDDTWMVDMGRSIVGWVRIRLGDLRKGQQVSISYCDMLALNGDFDYGVYTDRYIASGVGEESFCNKFTYHAYRYMKIQGLGHQPKLSDIEGLSIYTGYEKESAFVCNDEDINAIHNMVHYTFKCLTQSGYMVDCPHHERQGYGGDGNASILAAQTMYDMYPLYKNWLQAYGDAQGEDGEVPHVAPATWVCGGGPFWCAFIANAPWQTYLQYGDKRMLEQFYPNMQRYLQYAEKYMPDGLLSLENRWPTSQLKHWFLGDWALPNEEHQHHTESIDDVNSCSMSWVYGIMARVAEVLGKPDDAALYQQKQQDINGKIHQKFYNKKEATYASGLQLDAAFPLFVGATPKALRDKVNSQLKKDIYGRWQGHLFTGLVGVPIVTQWLTRAGEAQVMYDMLKQRSFPGYLYMIENGATTTWEHWNARRSRIHNCYNGIGSWFYQALAGIVPDEKATAYRHFFIRPQMVSGISFVRAMKPTPYGDITVDWNLSEQTFDIRLSIPPGTTATLEIPACLKCKTAEMPPTSLMRYGLIYNENQRDKKTDTPPTILDATKPIELQSGTYRIIGKMKE